MTNREWLIDQIRSAPPDIVHDLFVSYCGFDHRNYPIESACMRCLRLHGDQCPDLAQDLGGTLCRAGEQTWADQEAVAL